MPLLTYISAFEAARTTAGGRVANGAADAMQKVCETIGLNIRLSMQSCKGGRIVFLRAFT